MKPAIVLVGRINVGKSSLFNRLTESGKALVSTVAGTTRDYNAAPVNWQGRTFDLIDTGGVNIDILQYSIESLLDGTTPLPKTTEEEIDLAIVKQTKKAIDHASMVMMVVNAHDGILPDDKKLAQVLKKLGKKIILVVNKSDNPKLRNAIAEFYQLGLGEPIPVSAVNGSGVGDMLDYLMTIIPTEETPDNPIADLNINVAIIGKPNVGKSSLINALVGEERVIVSPLAHTTREPQDTIMEYQGYTITLIDTAGIRKKSKIIPGLEKKSTRRALQAIKRADIVLFVTEADKKLSSQDSYLAGLLKENGVGIIMVANKWDALEDVRATIGDEMRNYYRQKFPWMHFAPLQFVSATTGKNIDKLFNVIIEVWQQRQRMILKSSLNSLLKRMVHHHRPAKAKGFLKPRIVALQQTGVNPPHFIVVIAKGESLHFSYIRYIENQLRHQFGFEGTPLKITIKSL